MHLVDAGGRLRAGTHAERRHAQGLGTPRRRLAGLAQPDDQQRLAFDRLDLAVDPLPGPLRPAEAREAERKRQHHAERIFRHHVGGDAGGVGDGDPGRIPGPEMVRA